MFDTRKINKPKAGSSLHKQAATEAPIFTTFDFLGCSFPPVLEQVWRFGGMAGNLAWETYHTGGFVFNWMIFGIRVIGKEKSLGFCFGNRHSMSADSFVSTRL